MLVVYRGAGTESTAIEKAISWTLDKTTAVGFANNWGHAKVSGVIFTAQIKYRNIVDYLSGRNEQEILLNYKDLVNVTHESESADWVILLEQHFEKWRRYQQKLIERRTAKTETERIKITEEIHRGLF